MRTKKTIFLHLLIFIVLCVIGIFTLIDGTILAGKYTGHIYQLEYPANIIVAASIFMLALFFVVILKPGERIKKLGEWLLIASFVVFTIGFFI